MVCRRPLSPTDRAVPLEDFEQIRIPNVERGWSNEGGSVDSDSAPARVAPLRLLLDREDTERRGLLVHVRTPNFTNMRGEGGRCAFEIFLGFATLAFIAANIDAGGPANAILFATLKNEQLEI